MLSSDARPKSYQTFLDKMSVTLSEVDKEYDSQKEKDINSAP